MTGTHLQARMTNDARGEDGNKKDYNRKCDAYVIFKAWMTGISCRNFNWNAIKILFAIFSNTNVNKNNVYLK